MIQYTKSLKPMSSINHNKLMSGKKFLDSFNKNFAEKKKTMLFDRYSLEKEYVARYKFKTKNSSDIKYSLMKVAEETIDRNEARMKLFKYVKLEPLAYEIEKGILERALIEVTINKLQEHFVENIYRDKLNDICSNLDVNDKHIDNQTLLPTLFEDKFAPYFVAFLSADQLHPKRWAEIMMKRQVQDETVNNLQTTDMYQCRKCKERKFKITRLQLRCADESENVFYTCMVCYTTFIK